MKRFLRLFCILLFALVGGCSRDSLMKMMTSSGDDAVAKNYIALLRQDQFDKIQKDIDPKIAGTFNRDTFEKMRAEIPEGEPLSITQVGVQTLSISNTHSFHISYEYQFPGKLLLINVSVKKENGATTTITGLDVQPVSESMGAANKFTFAGKSLPQYVMLGAACVVPLFTLYALIACFRTKMQKRKWLWIIFIICGLGKLSMDWSTGHIALVQESLNAAGDRTYTMEFLGVQLFGASAVTTNHEPWILSVSFPLGALMFLLNRRKFAAEIPRPRRQMRMGDE